MGSRRIDISACFKGNLCIRWRQKQSPTISTAYSELLRNMTSNDVSHSTGSMSFWYDFHSKWVQQPNLYQSWTFHSCIFLVFRHSTEWENGRASRVESFFDLICSTELIERILFQIWTSSSMQKYNLKFPVSIVFM